MRAARWHVLLKSRVPRAEAIRLPTTTAKTRPQFLGPFRVFGDPMSKRTSASSAKAGDKLVVLFGVDEDGKSCAAKFAPAQADLARKAAQLMSLECEETNADALGDLA